MLTDKTEPQEQALIDLVNFGYHIVDVYDKHLTLRVKVKSKLDPHRTLELRLPVSGGWVSA